MKIAEGQLVVPPSGDDDFDRWMDKTFPPGTRLRFPVDIRVRPLDGNEDIKVDAGTIAVVTGMDGDGSEKDGDLVGFVEFKFKKHVQLFTSSSMEEFQGYIDVQPGWPLPFDVYSMTIGGPLVVPSK